MQYKHISSCPKCGNPIYVIEDTMQNALPIVMRTCKCFDEQEASKLTQAINSLISTINKKMGE